MDGYCEGIGSVDEGALWALDRVEWILVVFRFRWNEAAVGWPLCFGRGLGRL